jgi:hypothetical protein
MAASKALPPLSKISKPAWVAVGCAEAMAACEGLFFEAAKMFVEKITIKKKTDIFCMTFSLKKQIKR